MVSDQPSIVSGPSFVNWISPLKPVDQLLGEVIETDLNKKTSVNEYFYDTDLDLSFINIFQSENNIRDRVYSIEINTLRVDVWSMTGGGFTTREMFPMGLCEFVENDDIFSQIKNLKSNL